MLRFKKMTDPQKMLRTECFMTIYFVTKHLVSFIQLCQNQGHVYKIAVELSVLDSILHFTSSAVPVLPILEGAESVFHMSNIIS